MREEEIFLEALARDPADRAAFLDRACPDPAVRASVEALLRANIGASRFLESPVEPAVTVGLPPTERPGTVIGPYKLLEQIGEGGFGAVFMAEQSEPVRRKVALKVLKAGMDTRQVVARFEAERQALAIMDHPNIARVFDGGATPSGRPYFVMELVKGVPITEYCDQNHLTPRQRLELFMQVCHAVQHAHQKGIIHRDIKPSNVLVTVHDTAPVVKVIDFGVAKAMGQELTDKTLFTGFAQMIGTPLYMSPEQAGQSGLDVDTRSDIYSLGVLLYELLTGSTPFTKERFRQAAYEEIRRIIREEEPPKPSTRLSSATESLPSISAQRQTEPAKLTRLVRGELDWIVMKALEKDRNRRYETANGFAMDVQRYLADEAVQACPPSAGYRFRKFARRNRGRLVAASVLGIALLVAMSGIGWAVRDRSARQAEAERERNERQARVTTQVELILADVDRLMEAQKWPEALSTAKRAEAALAGGEIDDATRGKVAEVIRDLQFIERLQRIRLENEIRQDGQLDEAEAVNKYRLAFAEMGLDSFAPAADESLLRRWENRPSLRIALAAAMDDLVFRMWQAEGPASGRWHSLVEVARRLDIDPRRNQFRSAWGKDRQEARKEILDLWQRMEVHGQNPGTLVLLALILERVGLRDEGLEVLRESQSVYPADFWINFQLAGMLLERNPAEAETYYRVALGIQPCSLGAHLNMGASLQDQKKLEEAISVYRNIIRTNPKYAAAYFNLGIALEEHGKLDEAITAYRNALQLQPTLAPSFIRLGRALRSAGKLDEAVAVFRNAIHLQPTNAVFFNALGITLRDLGQVNEAIACYRKAIQLDPKAAEPLGNLARILSDEGKQEEAVTAYRDAIKLDPKVAMIHTNLGTARWRQGDIREAIACYRMAIELDPKLAMAHSNLGKALKAQGRIEEAISCFRKAIELEIMNAGSHGSLGDALQAQGKMDEAIASYRKAIELDPKSVVTHNNLGNALKAQGRLDEAITCYRKAIELDPKNTGPHNNLGNALKAQGRLDEAIACYRKVIDLDPQDVQSHNNLAWLLLTVKDMKLRDPKGARRLALRAVQLDPMPWAYWNTLSIACFRAGDWKESLEARENAIRRQDEGSARCWNGLGLAMIQWQLDQRDNARKAYGRVAEESKKYRWLDGFRQEAEQLLGITPAHPKDK